MKTLIALALALAGCVSPVRSDQLTRTTADLRNSLSRVETALPAVEAAAAEAAAAGDAAAADDAAAKADRLREIRAKLQAALEANPNPAPVADGVATAAGAVSAAFPLAAPIAGTVAAIATAAAAFFRRREASAKRVAEVATEEAACALSDIQAATLIVRTLEDPEAARARELVSAAAKEHGLTIHVERLLENAGVRKPGRPPLPVTIL